MERGARERHAGGSASLKKKPRHAREGAPTTPGRRLRPRDMAGRFRGRGAEVGDALTGGGGLSAAGRRKQARGARPAVAWCGRRRSCWAGRGWRGCWAARSWAGREKGEASWAGAGAGPNVRKGRRWKEISFFFL